MDFSRYLSIPFVRRGRSLEGLDCYGVVWWVFHDLGIEMPRWEGGRGCDIGRELQEVYAKREGFMAHDWVEVPLAEAKLLDVFLIFDFGRWHVSVCTGGTRMLHTTQATGIVIEDFNRRRWQGKLKACFRHRSLAE